MKIIKALSIFTSVAMLCGCESYTKNQEMAIETVKSMCKSPSSFKLISAQETIMPASVKNDTTYYYLGYSKTKKEIRDGAKFDSTEVYKVSTIAYSVVDVVFDAQNAFGAMVRGNQDIRIDNNGKILFTIDDMTKKELIEAKKYDTPMAFPKK